MIIVADCSPLTALLTVGEADLLATLFSEVIIPTAVRDELLRGHDSLPDWIRIVRVENPGEAQRFAKIVDPGEAEAIELAKELDADRLDLELIDRELRPLLELKHAFSNLEKLHQLIRELR